MEEESGGRRTGGKHSVEVLDRPEIDKQRADGFA